VAYQVALGVVAICGADLACGSVQCYDHFLESTHRQPAAWRAFRNIRARQQTQAARTMEIGTLEPVEEQVECIGIVTVVRLDGPEGNGRMHLNLSF
jgi:hypothetical protein